MPNIAFEKYTLPNGLQVILHVDHSLPIVHINQWYHVGSKNERIGRSGFAHLFEHLMFEGSKNAPGLFDLYTEKLGGNNNGSTDWDRTNYITTVPASHLELLLWLESDRLATLGQVIDNQRFENQRSVVKNERRQTLENQPYGRWEKLIFENLFPYRHPYCNDVIGTHEDLDAATVEDARDFFRTFYTPNNLSLVIAGDFDPEQAKKLVEKYFGPIPAGPALDRPARCPASLDGQKTIEVRDRVAQERCYLAWHSPAFFDPGDAELDLASRILTDGLSSRLNRILVYDQRLCSDVVSFQQSLEAAGVFVIWATARPEVCLSRIEQIIDQQIALLARQGPTQEELNRAKSKCEYAFISSLQRIAGFGSRADRLNMYNTFLGEPGKFQADIDRYRNATAETVRQAVARFLNTDKRVLVRFRPERSTREVAGTVDRSRQPASASQSEFHPPEVQSARLANGLQVLAVERHDLPLVAVNLVMRAGAACEPPGKEGLASLLARTIASGTLTRTSLQIEEALGNLGTAISGRAARDYSILAMEVLARNLAPAMEIFADVARNPVFPVDEIDREKHLRLDALAQESTDPRAIAMRVGATIAFGPDHPYGRIDTPETVRSITRQDLARFHEGYWRPDAAALVFVGDISLEQATRLAEQHFASWSGHTVASAPVPAPRPAPPGNVFIVDRQGAAQTYIALFLPGISRKADDRHALSLLNTVLGGSFLSRLNVNLREEKGYTYGVRSRLLAFAGGGTWAILGSFHADKTRESLEELLAEVQRIAGDKPVSDRELDDAKGYRVQGYAQEFDSLSSIASKVAELWAQTLPMSELQQEPEQLRQATLAQIHACARKYAMPANALLLLVGDLAIIEQAVLPLHLGKLVLLDPQGRRIER